MNSFITCLGRRARVRICGWNEEVLQADPLASFPIGQSLMLDGAWLCATNTRGA